MIRVQNLGMGVSMGVGKVRDESVCLGDFYGKFSGRGVFFWNLGFRVRGSSSR